ncbi:MAG TPA: phage holin family protein [Desulfomonilaceae bacterium]|nr:phage holin family protein [Desulfomonilaceae bacterium]
MGHGIVISWIISTVAILIVAHLIPGIRVGGLGSAIIAAAILGLLNALVKPILVILTLPLTILTLGLFLLILNALMFQLAGAFTSGFRVESFWAALLGSIVVSIITYLLNSIMR